MDITNSIIDFEGNTELQKLVDNELHYKLSVRPKGYQFTPSFKNNYWDGYTLMHENVKEPNGEISIKFPTGLVPQVDDILGDVQNVKNFQYTIIDNRPDPFLSVEDIPETITLGSNTGSDIELRDYQYDAVKSIVEQHVGILHQSTNSGKTTVAAGIIKTLLPHLQKDERIVFFTHSTAIFNQAHAELEERLGIKLGKYGSGKKDIRQVTVAMVPTINASLKLDPEKGVKLTAKERIVKRMAKEIAPKFLSGINQKMLMKSYVSNFPIKTKVDTELMAEMEEVIRTSESDAKIKFKLNNYIAKYQKILETKNKDVMTKHSNTVKFLDSIAVAIVDECLVGDTLVVNEDGGWDTIDTFKQGDRIAGGEILELHKHVTPTVKLNHKFGLLEGSLTHPTFIVPKENYDKKEYTPVVKMLMEIKEGDYLVVPKTMTHTVKNNYTPEQLAFVALIQADGHLDKGRSSRTKVNVSKDIDWYREAFNTGVRSFKASAEVKESVDCRGNYTFWTNDTDVRYILETTFDIPTGKKSSDMKINKEIQYAPKDSVKAYVETLLNCEGDLSVSAAGSYRLNIGMCSKELIEGLSLLLRKFGILATYKEVPKKKAHHSTLHRLHITGGAYNTFLDNFSLLDRKTGEKNKDQHSSYRSFDECYQLSRVTKLTFFEEEKDVYDFTTESSAFMAGGTITHNCHHAVSDSFYNTLMSCNNAYYKTGLTGSIDPTDPLLNQRLKAIFGGVVSRVTNSQMIAEGVSAKPKIVITPINQVVVDDKIVDIANMKDYMRSYELGMVKNQYRNTLIAKITEMCYNDGEGILIIVNRIEHGQNIGALLEKLSIPYAFVQGEQDSDTREEHFTAMKNGSLRVMIATSLVDEGVSINNINSLIMASSGSMRQVLQRAGRVLRKKTKGENTATIFDFTDNVNIYLKKHGDNRRKIYEEEGFDIVDL